GLPLIVLAGLHAHEEVWILWSVLILLAVLSATQDIAIDAYTIELLEKHEMGVANGVRVTAYRLALIAARGLVVAAAGLAGWGMVFVGAAVLMGRVSMVSSQAPLADATPSAAQPRPPRLAAAALPPNAALMYVASLVESFCGGLGTAPFLAFLMSICSKAHAATQYALLSALFGLTRALSGAFSGVATEGMGYAAYFTATFF